MTERRWDDAAFAAAGYFSSGLLNEARGIGTTVAWMALGLAVTAAVAVTVALRGRRIRP